MVNSFNNCDGFNAYVGLWAYSIHLLENQTKTKIDYIDKSISELIRV